MYDDPGSGPIGTDSFDCSKPSILLYFLKIRFADPLVACLVLFLHSVYIPSSEELYSNDSATLQLVHLDWTAFSNYPGFNCELRPALERSWDGLA